MNDKCPRALIEEEKSPRPKNNRSRKGLVLGFLLILNIVFWADVAAAVTVKGQALFDCVNAIRTAKGNAPLSINGNLEMAARMKLDDMKEYGYWSHANPQTGAKPWDFVEEAGYDYSKTGENLAIGYADAAEICSAWKKSSIHLENIVSPDFTDAGIAIEEAALNNDSKGDLVVMMYGGKRTGSAVLGAAAEGKVLAATEGYEEMDNKSTQLRNVIAFVIMFSYIATFIVLLYNYLHKKKKGYARRGKALLLLFAALSIIMTLIFFLLIM